MRQLLLAPLLLLAATAIGQTSRTVTFTPIIDRVQPTTEAANGGTYVPGSDKFLSLHPNSVRVYSGADGAYESDLSTAGIIPGDVGFQAATATAGGHIYIVEN